MMRRAGGDAESEAEPFSITHDYYGAVRNSVRVVINVVRLENDDKTDSFFGFQPPAAKTSQGLARGGRLLPSAAAAASSSAAWRSFAASLC